MAYSRNLNQQCWSLGCTKKPLVEVFGSKNERHGEFCRKCGKIRVARLSQEEQEEFNRRTP